MWHELSWLGSLLHNARCFSLTAASQSVCCFFFHDAQYYEAFRFLRRNHRRTRQIGSNGLQSYFWIIM